MSIMENRNESLVAGLACWVNKCKHRCNNIKDLVSMTKSNFRNNKINCTHRNMSHYFIARNTKSYRLWACDGCGLKWWEEFT